MEGWDGVVRVVGAYVQMNAPSLEADYDWDVPVADGFDCAETSRARRSMALRRFYHGAWKQAEAAKDPEAKYAIARAYIADWGGVRSNSESTLRRYTAATDSELLSLGTRGIASWSKLLSVRNPDAYVIYDARVAFALNAVQQLHFGIPLLQFPMPPSRNTRIKTATRGLGKGVTQLLSRTEAYSRYLKLLQLTRGEHSLEEAEMVLFTAGPKLADAINARMGPSMSEAG